jgi:hypothetical protein
VWEAWRRDSLGGQKRGCHDDQERRDVERTVKQVRDF